MEGHCASDVCWCRHVYPDEIEGISDNPLMPPYWKPSPCKWPGHKVLDKLWQVFDEKVLYRGTP